MYTKGKFLDQVALINWIEWSEEDKKFLVSLWGRVGAAVLEILVQHLLTWSGTPRSGCERCEYRQDRDLILSTVRQFEGHLCCKQS